MLESERVLAEPLRVFTNPSVVDPSAMRNMLVQARVDGYAVNRCGHREEVSGIASPLRDHTGLAAVGLCLPTTASPKTASTSFAERHTPLPSMSRVPPGVP
jgi:DNA-binding IclR family transcriptional regulator